MFDPLVVGDRGSFLGGRALFRLEELVDVVEGIEVLSTRKGSGADFAGGGPGS
jgi:hypothetical protein